MIEYGGAKLTITPKLRLKDDARKMLLSCILKFRLLGMYLTSMSIHIMLAPTTQAAGTCQCADLERAFPPLTYPTCRAHNPTSSIIIHAFRSIPILRLRCSRRRLRKALCCACWQMLEIAPSCGMFSWVRDGNRKGLQQKRFLIQSLPKYI